MRPAPCALPARAAEHAHVTHERRGRVGPGQRAAHRHPSGRSPPLTLAPYHRGHAQAALEAAQAAADAGAYEEDEEEDAYEEEYRGEEGWWDPEEDMITLRGKWIYGGAESIDDMVACLQHEIKYLKRLRRDGWYVTDMDDDWVFLSRDGR
jgi:hypothetical protein